MTDIFKFREKTYDYGNSQNTAMQVTIKNWQHSWGVTYLGKERIAALDAKSREKLKRRFWRYIGAV